MSAARALRRMSEEEYLAWDLAHPEKHEYVNGEVLAMAGADPAHVFLTLSVAGELRARLRGRGCTAFSSDLRVRVSATRLYAYPDVVVTCGKAEYAPTKPRTLLNPRVIVEVLSPSTAEYDRGAKFAHYQRCPSLQEYVLVGCPERRIDHYRRLETGQWVLTIVEGSDTLLLPTLDVVVPLDDLYDGIEEHVDGSEEHPVEE